MSNSQVRPFEEIVVLESRISIKEFFLSSDKKWGESEKVSENRRNGNKVLKKGVWFYEFLKRAQNTEGNLGNNKMGQKYWSQK